MNCQRFSEERFAERYLLDDLREADREAFERHFFACDQCSAELETLRAVKERLKRDRGDVPRIALRPRPPIRWWWVVALAAAATATIIAMAC